MVLEKHQLKGIYMTHSSIRSAGHQLKRHKLRDRMIRYLNKKAKEEDDQREKVDSEKTSIKKK